MITVEVKQCDKYTEKVVAEFEDMVEVFDFINLASKGMKNVEFTIKENKESEAE